MKELRQKTQEMIDDLHKRVKDCQLAMLIDQKTGLVLCKSSESPTSQSKIEMIATDALEEMNATSAKAFHAGAQEPEVFSIISVRKADTLVIVQDCCCGEDALVCVTKNLPNRAYLTEVATQIFQLPVTMEAA